MSLSETLSHAGHRLTRTGSALFTARNSSDGRRQSGEGADRSRQQSRSHDDESTRARKKKAGGLPGGGKAIAAFIVSLFAFTIQTEAAQHVQQALGYRKPFLSLYLGHSAFIFLFPLYLACLRIAQPSIPLSHQFHLISLNLHWQLSAPTTSLPKPAADSIRRRLSSLSMRSERSVDEDELNAEDFDIEELEHRRRTKPPPARKSWFERRLGFHLPRLLGVFAVLTVGITVPALSWYSAVPLTTMADITTIYNTYAVWALVFSIWFLGEQWERRKVFSVLLACGGVVLVAYGGAEHRRRPREPDPAAQSLTVRAVDAITSYWHQYRRAEGAPSNDTTSGGGSNALLGDLLAFFGAVTMAAYEMAFKVVGTLPDEDAQAQRFGDRLARSYGRNDNARLEEDGRAHDDAESTGLLASTLRDDTELPAEQQQQYANNSNAIKDNQQQELGDHISDETDVDVDKAVRVPPSTERTAIWKALDGDGPNGRTASPSYQSMTPPVMQGDGASDDEGDLSTDVALDKHRRSLREASEEVTARLRAASEAEQSKALDEWIPPPLPFGMHPIIITSGIGLVTVCTLWIGLPIANALGWEPFELPGNLKTYVYLFVVAFSGIIFNACFSILLALWGPVLASVSCLLTTVLVFAADLLLGHDFRWISLLGCVSIVAGFGVLVSGGGLH